MNDITSAATSILQELFGYDSKDTLETLKNHNYRLLKEVQTSISNPCSSTEKLP